MAPEVLNCPFKNKPEENKDDSRLHYTYHVDTVGGCLVHMHDGPAQQILVRKHG